MDKDLKLNIINEGQALGVTLTCNKYKISRTLYYRWLKRYKDEGLSGLEGNKRNFIPANKTDIDIEKALLSLIKTYPHYGPRALKYLLEEIGHHISESAVFNILKRHGLSNKMKRLNYVKKRIVDVVQTNNLDEYQSGECWLFWITELGNIFNNKKVFLYNFIDYKSKIACSRVYQDIAYTHFEDLLTSVALSIATSLDMKIKFLLLDSHDQLMTNKEQFLKSTTKSINDHGYKLNVKLVSNIANKKLNLVKSKYLSDCVEFLMPLMTKESFDEIKIDFQRYIREYNVTNKLQYDSKYYSPIEYHNLKTNTKLVLPIWAYLDRTY